MSVTNKALFVIERNLHGALTLDQIAKQCDVSRFHLAHAFGDATGRSVVEYLRGRRLTEAARRLAAGAGDILDVALDSCYGSHEAFSRAFKAQFDRTPEEVRKSGSVEGLHLVEAIRHLAFEAATLKDPRIERSEELLFAGLAEHVAYSGTQNLAGQWGRFMSGPYPQIEHKVAEPPTGIICGSDDDGFDSVCAARVTKFGFVPGNCIKLTLPAATYAVFAHDGHVTQVRETYAAIWNEWFPASGKTPAKAPSLERHNLAFDPRTGKGGLTLWIPVDA